MKLREEHLERAYFVGGVSGYFRDASDPKVKAALDAMTELLDNLPASLQSPKLISGGLTETPDVILDFSWWTGWSQGSQKVMITVKENALFDLEIDLSGISRVVLCDLNKQQAFNQLMKTNALWPFLGQSSFPPSP